MLPLMPAHARVWAHMGVRTPTGAEHIAPMRAEMPMHPCAHAHAHESMRTHARPRPRPGAHLGQQRVSAREVGEALEGPRLDAGHRVLGQRAAEHRHDVVLHQRLEHQAGGVLTLQEALRNRNRMSSEIDAPALSDRRRSPCPQGGTAFSPSLTDSAVMNCVRATWNAWNAC